MTETDLGSGSLIDLARELELWPLDRLHGYERNPKRHPERQLDRIVASILEYGFVSPILVSGDVVRAGHARLEAARRIEAEAPGSFPDGVPVVRLDHLSEAQAERYVIADNRLAELGEWDEETLAAELDRLELDAAGLDALGFTEDELAELLPAEEESRAPADPVAEPDDDLEEPADPKTREGDVWRLGDHVLICGDATDSEVVRTAIDGERLACVITDPPFAIYGSSTGVDSSVADDRMVRPFFTKVLRIADRALEWFGHAYVFCDWRSWPAWFDSARAVRTIEAKNLLVWDKKGGSGLGSNYGNAYELLGFFHRKPPKERIFKKTRSGSRSIHKANILAYGRTGQGPGFEADHEDRERFHNAQKPVHLLRDLIRNSSPEGGRVFDPFVGSGSTLIAAELDGRRCVAIEIDPARVDVAIARWERFTGKTAERD